MQFVKLFASSMTLPSRFLALGLFLASPAVAQVHFSIDNTGPTAGAAVLPADILVPGTGSGFPAMGPLPAPVVAIPKGALGLLGSSSQELDALSYGVDRTFDPHNADPIMSPFGLHFSVDDFAVGLPALGPDVASEAFVFDACADVFASPLFGFPLPPGPGMNTGVIDGDGLPSGSGAAYPGVGLVEPGTPGAQDDIDALDMESGGAGPNGVPGAGIFYSLDSSYIDPITSTPHSATALGVGVVGGDILYSPAAGVSIVWAPANILGLDIVPGAGPDSDDLDALIVWENGDGQFFCGQEPMGWLAGWDMVLFSVRRGSAVIGMPDSLFGVPICEGDILMPPVFFGGSGSPYPAIFIAAENLGLATVRSGTANYSDDLDAADYVWMGPELITNEYCFCDSTAPAPCGNYDATAGCANSTGVGGLLKASGSTNAFFGSLSLTASQLPTGKPGLLFIGPNQAMIPFVDGLRCVVGSVRRLKVANSGSTGSMSFNGVVNLAAARGLTITPGQNWNLQTWYRDNGGPCGTGSNLTNAVSALFW